MRAIRGSTAVAALLSALFSAAPSATAGPVDAGTVTTIAVNAPLYDPNLGDASGCDPAGCVGDLTRDGDATGLGSRWSCKPALDPGSMCTITYTLGESLDLDGLNIAMYKGNERVRTMDIYVDDALVTTWTSSGTTAGFEGVPLGVAGERVELRGVLADSEWLSIMEVEILVDDDDVVEAGTVGTVVTAAALYDPNLSIANGCDPSGCTASLTRDGDFTPTSRWSCAPSLGGLCTISYDLGAVRDLSELRVAMYKGTTRRRTVEVYLDGVLVTTWTSSGTTSGMESIDLSETSGQLIELTGVLANSEWISIVETEIMVMSDNTSEPPSPGPSTSTPPPVLSPEGDLQPIGLLSLAYGSSFSSTGRYNIKDGDLSTAWTCTADFSQPWTSDCEINFRLEYYRHLKQVKIALPGGAERAVNMKITASNIDTFVTSSGTTDGFETYDFDVFTRNIEISAVFTGDEQSISISEVEFVEEVQAGIIPIAGFSYPDINQVTLSELEFSTDSSEASGLVLRFDLSSFAELTAVELQFPVGDTYQFDLLLSSDEEDFEVLITGLESADAAGWQTFELGQLVPPGQSVTDVDLVMQGTGSGADGFRLLDARFVGTPVEPPNDSRTVGSTRIEEWTGIRYPDFVGAGTGDQKAIQEAICSVKKASFDGVDCVGGDPTATGKVILSMGSYYVDGNIFMKSGVHLEGQFSIDDDPNETTFILEEDAGGKTDVDAMIVMDGVTDALIEDLFIRGLYDPDTSNANPAVTGLGSTGISISNSQNVTCKDIWVTQLDGDAVVVRDSNIINIDAGRYDDEFLPFAIAESRGTGLVVDGCDSVWVRRHAMYDNGVAGIHISGSNNFTFEATIGSSYPEGEGLVGSIDGQQPIEVIVESSSLVTFQDMKISSDNEPVMTISADSSAVSFINCGFSSVTTDTCVIQTEDPSVVSAVDDELTLDGTCYVKVEG